MTAVRNDPRQRVIDAAITLFARFGFGRTTLTDIANRAHLSKATLYHHFPEGKASLFETAVHQVIEVLWNSVIADVQSVAGPVPRLLRYITLRIETFDREVMARGVDREVWGDMKAGVEMAIAEYLSRELILLRELLDAGIAEGSIVGVDSDFGSRFLQAALRGLTLDGPIETTARERRRDTDQLLAVVRNGMIAPAAAAIIPRSDAS